MYAYGDTGIDSDCSEQHQPFDDAALSTFVDDTSNVNLG